MSWWLTAHWHRIRTALIVAATLLSIAGLCASFTDCKLSIMCWAAAFLCKWGECWLLERELVAVQLELEAQL